MAATSRVQSAAHNQPAHTAYPAICFVVVSWRSHRYAALLRLAEWQDIQHVLAEDGRHTAPVCALPVIGSMAGNSVKLAFRGTRYINAASRADQYIKTASHLVSNTAQLGMGIAATTKSFEQVREEYKNGDVSGASLAELGLSALCAIFAVSGMRTNGSRLRKMAQADDAGCVIKSAFTGKKHCFPAGTLVETAEGEQKIEEIEEGEYVLSENPYTKPQN